MVSGNFDIAARVANLTLSDTWAKAGLMARESLAANGPFAATLATPVLNGCFLEWRGSAGSATQSGGTFPDNYPNTWLRLNRVGNLFSGLPVTTGKPGRSWPARTIALANQLYLGFAVDSDQTNQTVTAQFLPNHQYRPPMRWSGRCLSLRAAGLRPAGRRRIVFSEIMWKPAPRADTQQL